MALPLITAQRRRRDTQHCQIHFTVIERIADDLLIASEEDGFDSAPVHRPLSVPFLTSEIDECVMHQYHSSVGKTRNGLSNVPVGYGEGRRHQKGGSEMRF